MSTSEQRGVLFVCMGNICRSPAGEAVFLTHLKNENCEEEVFVDSCGTISYHAGRPADPRMQDAASRRGHELTSIARRITPADLETYHLVIAMDRDNLSDIHSLPGRKTATVRLLSAYLDDRWPVDVPDPYYGGEDGFEVVLDMIEAACPAILAELLNRDPS